MDVFALRDQVVAEYHDCFASFLNVRHKRLRQFVQQCLERAERWPDSVPQVNPAYLHGTTLAELAHEGVFTSATAPFFGETLADLGYRVIIHPFDQPFDVTIASYNDLFVG